MRRVDDCNSVDEDKIDFRDIQYMKLTVLDISEKDRIKTTTQFPAYILSKVLEEAGKLKKKKKKSSVQFYTY